MLSIHRGVLSVLFVVSDSRPSSFDKVARTIGCVNCGGYCLFSQIFRALHKASSKFCQFEVASSIRWTVPRMMFLLKMVGAIDLNDRIKPVYVGFCYHAVDTIPSCSVTSMSKKGMLPLSSLSTVNSRFVCSLFDFSRISSFSCVLALRITSSTNLPVFLASTSCSTSHPHVHDVVLILLSFSTENGVRFR